MKSLRSKCKVMTGMAAVGLISLLPSCASSSIQREVAAVHSDTTPFSAFKRNIEISSGQTYLSLMRHQIKPALDSFEVAIKAEESKYPNQYSKWQTDLITDGSGLAIRINSGNYFFNVGYLDGSEADDIKSGRSYGVGPTGRETDPSDEFYLNELESYLKSEPTHIGDFYKAIMMMITDCNSAGWETLSSDGQTVATDFMAIYTAESDRHLMVGLKPSAHPWEIDLAAATFASIFDTSTGMINTEISKSHFQLEIGGVGQWWAKGQQGSGIGETRGARTDLTRKITAYENKNHPEIVSAVTKALGNVQGDDVIQNMFAYFNSPDGPDKLAQAKAEEITDALVRFVLQVQSDASAIKNGI